MPHFPPSDAALVLRTLSGHPEAFEALVLRNIKKAHAIARSAGLRDDAVEDAVQEGFLRAFRDLHSLKDPASFTAWLLAIVRNAARKQLARRHDLPFNSTAVESDAASPEGLEGKEFREHLWSRVSQLPEEVREAIFLYYHEGESIRSVARSLEITVSGAKKRLRKGRDLLRERLWRELEDSLREMLPSTRDWKRKAGKLALLTATSLPAAWAARLRAQPLEPAGISSVAGTARAPASLIGQLILGGFVMSVKKAVLISVIIIIVLGVLATRLVVRSSTDKPKEIALRWTPLETGEPAREIREAAVDIPGAPPAEGEARAVSGSGRIVVVLFAEDGLPIEAAEVRSTGVREWVQENAIPDDRVMSVDFSIRGTSAARSGLDGSAALVDLPFGEYALDIEAEGFGREHLEDVQLSPESEEQRVEITLTIACSIHGRVRDPAGRPVEGCEITVDLHSPPSAEASWRRVFHDSVRSDDDGEFRLDALPFGAYSVEARKPGFRTEVRGLAPNALLCQGDLSGEGDLSFDTGKSIEVLVLAYDGGRSLEGTVTCRGQPVPRGSKIRMDLKAEDPEMEDVFFRDLTSPDWSWTAPGEYQIRDCVPGTHEVEVRGPGMAKLLVSLEVPEGEGVLRKDFQLEPGGVIRGWLVRHGRGSPGRVYLFRRTDPGWVELKEWVHAGPDGLFSFPDRLEDGSYLVAGFASGHPAGILADHKSFKSRALPGEVEVQVEDGAGPQEILVESPSGAGGVSGRVVDTSGRPVPGASLHLVLDASGLQTEGYAKASEAGEFAITGLSPGSLELQVDARGFGTIHAEAILRETDDFARLDVVMERARTFRARLEYADGEPDSGPRVVLEQKAGEGWRHQRGGRPGDGIQGGVFQAENLPPGIYRVCATFQEHAELCSPDIDLREVEWAEVVLRAEAGAAVSGGISFEELAR